jgi:hypothetical protein
MEGPACFGQQQGGSLRTLPDVGVHTFVLPDRVIVACGFLDFSYLSHDSRIAYERSKNGDASSRAGATASSGVRGQRRQRAKSTTPGPDIPDYDYYLVANNAFSQRPEMQPLLENFTT